MWWLRAALCGIALLAYANSFSTGFALDPTELVLQDPRIRAVTAENLALILKQEYLWLNYSSGLYRPVTTASFLLNYAVLGNGESPAGYHWVNFLLHVVNVWLVFALAHRLFRARSAAFIAAAVWAVHPVTTEAVTNIGGRADLLAAFAVLSGLLCYLRGPVWAVLPFALLGVFAKENAIVLLGLMLWCDATSSEGWTQVRRRFPAYAAGLASLGIFLLVRLAVFRRLPYAEPPFVDNPLAGAGFWTARLTAIKVVALDLWLLVCPLKLSSDRSYDQIPLGGESAWVALCVLAAIAALVFILRRKDRLILWSAGFFLIALLPTSNLIVPIGSIMAERFLYLPSVGFAIALAALAGHVGPERLRFAIVAVVLTALAFLTYSRNPAWQDSLSLASEDVHNAPRSFKLHSLLAQELFRQDVRANIDRVIQEQEKTCEILRPLPDNQTPQQSLAQLGDAYVVKGNLSGGPSTPEGRLWYEKGIPVLERAREISRLHEKSWDDQQRAHGKPLGERFASQDLYYDLGVAYGSVGRYPEALETLLYGRDIQPARPDFYAAIAAAYTALNQPANAAIAALQGNLVSDNSPQSAALVSDMYSHIEGGTCAVVDQPGGPKLNLDCPRLRADFCPAAQALARAYRASRRPEQAEEITRRYGCRSTP